MLFKVTFLFLAATAYAAVPASIVRPCETVECVTRHLAAQSSCNPHVRGFVPDEYWVDRFRFDAPFFNATFIDNNLLIRNHHKCYISEFYYNIATKKVVLALDCPLLQLQSTRTVIQHYSLREDLTYNYKFRGTYPLVRLTISMPSNNRLDICHAFTFADVTALPLYDIIPNDKKTANFLSRDDTLLYIFEREAFFWRARELAHFFINSIICDFGCDF